MSQKYSCTRLQVHAHTLNYSISVKMADDLKPLNETLKCAETASQIQSLIFFFLNEPRHRTRQRL